MTLIELSLNQLLNSTIASLLTLENTKLFIINMENTYFNGDLDFVIYMKQSKNFIENKYADTNI